MYKLILIHLHVNSYVLLVMTIITLTSALEIYAYPTNTLFLLLPERFIYGLQLAVGTHDEYEHTASCVPNSNLLPQVK